MSPRLAALACVILAGCANVGGSPEGGPRDMTPPVVVHPMPDSGATNVRSRTVGLSFTEPMDRRSVESSLLISPPTDGPLTFRWHGYDEVTITLPGELLAERTYRVTLGTGAKDLREGNRLVRPYTLAFSTGETLDLGLLSGVVREATGLPVAGAWLLAYRTDGLRADTLNPATARADYLDQTGPDGRFTLANLAPGTYRLMAVQSTGAGTSGPPRPELARDRLALPLSGDVTLARAGQRTGLTLVLPRAPADTLGPRLLVAEPLDRETVRLGFDGPFDPADSLRVDLALTDTLTGAALTAVSGLYRRSDRPTSLYLRTAPQTADAPYRMTITGPLRDAAGNPSAGPLSATFIGSAAADTSRPRLLTATPASGSTTARSDGEIRLRFSEPLDTARLVGHVTLTDSARTRIAGRLSFPTPVELRFQPTAPLVAEVPHTVQIDSLALADLAGNPARHPLRITFTPRGERRLGRIDGRIEADSGAARGPYLLIVRPLAAAGDSVALRLPGPGPFTVDALGEGSYQLQAVALPDALATRPLDPAGRLPLTAAETGRLFDGRPTRPFTPPAPRAFLSDTLRVRPRFGTPAAPLRFVRP